MTDTIRTFDGKNEFLSNFYDSRVLVKGHVYPTSEHAFQAMKTLVDAERWAFTDEDVTPGQSKRMGRKLMLRHDWEDVKYQMMNLVVWCKFTQNSDILNRLLLTGDAWLIEGNTWHDNTWGDCMCGRAACAEGGLNWLGSILMNVRSTMATAPKAG